MPIVWKRAPILVVTMLTTALFLMSACGGGDEKSGGSTSGDGATQAVEGDTTGVTDTSIKIGALLPMSNNSAAAWGIPLSQGMKAYFDYINDQGGIYGRKIELIVGDNQYTGAAASEAARKLVERDKVFAFQGAVGTAAHSAVYKYLEENGVPDMFLLTGNTMFTEPIVKTRFGLLVDYITEGRILAKYVSDNYAGKKLGIIVQNDDAGKEAESGVRQGLEEYGAGMEVVVEYYDETQSDMIVPTQRLQNEEVDIILILGGPVQVGSTLKAARETLDWQVPMAISSVNAVEIVARLAGYRQYRRSCVGHNRPSSLRNRCPRSRQISGDHGPLCAGRASGQSDPLRLFCV